MSNTLLNLLGQEQADYKLATVISAGGGVATVQVKNSNTIFRNLPVTGSSPTIGQTVRVVTIKGAKHVVASGDLTQASSGSFLTNTNTAVINTTNNELTIGDVLNSAASCVQEEPGNILLKAFNGRIGLAGLEVGIFSNYVPTASDFITQSNIILQAFDRSFIAGHAFNKGVDLISFEGGKIVIGYDAGLGETEIEINGPLTVNKDTYLGNIYGSMGIFGHLKTGTIWADAIITAGVQAETGFTIGDGGSFNYASMRYDADAFWLDTSAPYIALTKWLVIHGDYSGSHYQTTTMSVDAGNYYFITQSTNNMSFGVSAQNWIFFFGSAGANVKLDLSGTASDGPGWYSSGDNHSFLNSAGTRYAILDLSQTAYAQVKTSSNRISFIKDSGAWIKFDLTTASGDNLTVTPNSTGVKFAMSASTKILDFDTDNVSIGAASTKFKVVTSGTYPRLTSLNGSNLEIRDSTDTYIFRINPNSAGVQIDAPQGSPQTLYFSGGKINFGGATGVLHINGTQVLKTRITGWTAWTGNAARGGYATSTATLVNVAETMKALIDDLITHGLIGA